MASQKFTEFRWSTARIDAAKMVAEDTLTDEQIAGVVGVTRRQLATWKLHPLFQARVSEHITAYQEAVKGRGIADLQNRVDAYNRDWLDLERVKLARGEHYAGQVPGGETGLIVGRPVSVKVMNGDEDDPRFVEVQEYRIDGGLLDARLKIAKQAAQELGQWVERSEGRSELAILGLVGVRVEDI